MKPSSRELGRNAWPGGKMPQEWLSKEKRNWTTRSSICGDGGPLENRKLDPLLDPPLDPLDR